MPAGYYVELIGTQETLDGCVVRLNPAKPYGKEIYHWLSDRSLAYHMGKLPPNYPVPSRIGVVEIEPTMVNTLPADDGFDPWFTFDAVNGRWPEDSPNHPSKF